MEFSEISEIKDNSNVIEFAEYNYWPGLRAPTEGELAWTLAYLRTPKKVVAEGANQMDRFDWLE